MFDPHKINRKYSKRRQHKAQIHQSKLLHVSQPISRAMVQPYLDYAYANGLIPKCPPCPPCPECPPCVCPTCPDPYERTTNNISNWYQYFISNPDKGLIAPSSCPQYQPTIPEDPIIVPPPPPPSSVIKPDSPPVIKNITINKIVLKGGTNITKNIVINNPTGYVPEEGLRVRNGTVYATGGTFGWLVGYPIAKVIVYTFVNNVTHQIITRYFSISYKNSPGSSRSSSDPYIKEFEAPGAITLDNLSQWTLYIAQYPVTDTILGMWTNYEDLPVIKCPTAFVTSTGFTWTNLESDDVTTETAIYVPTTSAEVTDAMDMDWDAFVQGGQPLSFDPSLSIA